MTAIKKAIRIGLTQTLFLIRLQMKSSHETYIQ